MLYKLHDLPKSVTLSSSIVAIDYGLKKVGFCFKSSVVDFPTVFKVLQNDSSLVHFLNSFLANNAVSLLIVGLPRKKNGIGFHPLEDEILAFLQELSYTGCVYRADERFSTQYAIGVRNSALRVISSKQKIKASYDHEDAFAAQFLMDCVLDYLRNIIIN